MAEEFGSASTSEDVLDGLDLTGKRYLVTGISAGIGVETARALIGHGASVVGAVRNIEKTRKATAAIDPDALSLTQLELSDLDSVRACADRLLEAGEPLEGIIANAAVMAVPELTRTKDGFELQFATNHLGHFLLVNRLAPLLEPGSRVVFVSSAGHRFSDVDLDDPHFERTGYDAFPAYGRSKTANILTAVEFDRRHRDRGIRAASLHPGVIQTELMRHLPESVRAQSREQSEMAIPGDPSAVLQHKTVPQGAATSLWAAVRAPADLVGGRYCENCGVAPISADDSEGRRGVRPYAVDPDRARALWTLTERLVGEAF